MRLSTKKTVGRWLIDALRRIAALEYSLLDACEAAAVGAGNAPLSTRAGAAQVHLFDLGTALRELGDASPCYSMCVRQSLLHGGTPDDVLRRLELACEQALSRADVPDDLRVLLRANLAEHKSLVYA